VADILLRQGPAAVDMRAQRPRALRRRPLGLRPWPPHRKRKLAVRPSAGDKNTRRRRRPTTTPAGRRAIHGANAPDPKQGGRDKRGRQNCVRAEARERSARPAERVLVLGAGRRCEGLGGRAVPGPALRHRQTDFARAFWSVVDVATVRADFVAAERSHKTVSRTPLTRRPGRQADTQASSCQTLPSDPHSIELLVVRLLIWRMGSAPACCIFPTRLT
jgi:hypothetical protein